MQVTISFFSKLFNRIHGKECTTTCICYDVNNVVITSGCVYFLFVSRFLNSFVMQWTVAVAQLTVGFHRYVIQDFMSEQEVEEFDPPVDCTVWGYFSYADVVHKTSVQKTLSFAGSSIDLRPVPLHASSCWKIWHASPPQRITATGGASANQSILNSRASIFGGDVRTKTWSPAVAFTSFSYSGFSELDSSPDGCENLVLSWQALHP